MLAPGMRSAMYGRYRRCRRYHQKMRPLLLSLALASSCSNESEQDYAKLLDTIECEPTPMVLFMPGCGFTSCGPAQGGPWLTHLRNALDGIIPAANITLVPYTAGRYPN